MDEVTEADTIWSRVRDKLDDAAALMPAGAQPPEFEEFTIDAYTTILGLVWLDDSEPNHAVLRRLAENLEDELRAVPGTKETDLFGHNPEEIIVEADAEQLALRGSWLRRPGIAVPWRPFHGG